VIAPDLLAAVGPLLDLLQEIGVRHYVCGSIASSAHGVARASIDADVVAELLPQHAGGESLDRRYLEDGARELAVSDLLVRALTEAGGG
jgi:hypothetical protein